MPFVEAKCTNCGALLTVDNSKDAAVCQYCGTPFIVEKAINHYHTTNHISGSVVNIYGANSLDFVIRAGTLVKYNGAETDVEIPNTVKIIGKEAFCGCEGLTKVTIPEGVNKIEEKAFSRTGLVEVIVPNSVKVIGPSAFSYCTRLKRAVFPYTIDYVFPNCIAEYMFCGCIELVDFDIPAGIQYIGRSAFSGCRKINMTIPPAICSFGPGAFSGCTNLRNIAIPLEMKIIGDATFSGCSNLTNVSIHQGVNAIGNYAFNGCSKLTNVIIPYGVTSIGQCAFKNCFNLTNISIPDSVTDISPSAFEGCENINLNTSKAWKKENINVNPKWVEEKKNAKAIRSVMTLVTAIIMCVICVLIIASGNENLFFLAWYLGGIGGVIIAIKLRL